MPLSKELSGTQVCGAFIVGVTPDPSENDRDSFMQCLDAQSGMRNCSTARLFSSHSSALNAIDGYIIIRTIFVFFGLELPLGTSQ